MEVKTEEGYIALAGSKPMDTSETPVKQEMDVSKAATESNTNPEPEEEPHQQDNWVDFIENEDLDARFATLVKLKMALSKSLKLKDTKRAYREKTLCVFPVTLQEVSTGFLAPYVERGTYVGTWSLFEQETFGGPSNKSVCYISYKREETVEEKLTQLKAEKPDVCAYQLMTLYKDIFGDAEPSIFDVDEEDKKPLQMIKADHEVLINTITHVPNFREDLTLFTNSISESVTTDTLWMMFPLAKSISKWTVPFMRVYIIFENETKLQENITSLKAQTPTLAPFQLARVSDARQAFIKLVHPRRNRRSKATKQGADMPGQADLGKQGSLQQNSAANELLASPAQQTGVSPTPESGAGKGQRRKGGRQGAQTQPGSAAQTPDSQGPAETVAQDGPSLDPQTGQQKLSKGQMKRLKRKENKMRQESGPQETSAQQQGPQQQQQQKWPQQQQQQNPPTDIAAGLALLQTLTSLAQNMSGSFPQFGSGNMNQMGPPQNAPRKASNNNPGPKARKRMKQERQQQNRTQMDQDGDTPLLQQLHDQRQNQPSPPKRSLQTPGQADGGNWKQPQQTQGEGTGQSKKKRRNQKRRNSAASQQSDIIKTPPPVGYGQNYATQDYTSFESSAQNPPPVPQYGDLGCSQDYGGNSTLGYGGQGLLSNSQSSFGRTGYSYDDYKY